MGVYGSGCLSCVLTGRQSAHGRVQIPLFWLVHFIRRLGSRFVQAKGAGRLKACRVLQGSMQVLAVDC